jgi:hypothetical protein
MIHGRLEDPAICHLIKLRHKYSLQHPILEYTQNMPYLTLTDHN